MTAQFNARCLICGSRHLFGVACPKAQQQPAITSAHVDCDSCGIAHEIDKQGAISFAWCGGLPKVVHWRAWSMR
jgi:hypothetical protein